ncbi:MAG TPA: tRNA (cytidine(56)-2'-O)-methyltransferase [Thermoplasmata archaeon]|nr:tRNA (cytidine(56)-2'-O)-methyltransferase [Thermoplasmata archaeon]
MEVLRLGHRPGRDPRLTTHLALTARAWGARRLHLHPPDDRVAATLAAVAARWGGSFSVVGTNDWRSLARGFGGPTVHLTMYGRPIGEVLRRLRLASRVLVIVGGAKVPPDVFGIARYNVSVGTQPHSEVAALAVFLDRLGGVPSRRSWRGARQAIVPSRRGKQVRTRAVR